MKIVEQIKDNREVPKQLALPEKKEVPTEITEIEQKYFDKYGINNTTAKYIRERKSKLKETEDNAKKDFAYNEILKNITNSFGVYTVVSYKTMDDIAKQYNLYMSGLDRYELPIPQSNLEELDQFTEYLKNMDEDLVGKLECNRNDRFTFDTRNKTTLPYLGFNEMFYVMAPKSHLSKREDDISIGREIQKCSVEKPKFKYEFKINRPEPKDPIIFFPFSILDKSYCAIITAWDEVADDLRIRKLI